MKPISAADISDGVTALTGDLSASVTRTMSKELSGATKRISGFIKAGLFEEAKAEARDLTFTSALEKSEKSIQKFMRAAALTGAGAVDSPTTSIMANGGGFPFEVDKSAVRLTQNMIANILTRDTRKRLLALILRAQRFQKATDPIDPDDLAKQINRYLRGEIRRVVDVSANIVGTRVSAYGMYHEARARGISKYRIDAILDDRTTDICKELNGRTFDIEFAYSKTQSLLNETDPTKQKAMAPFPELSTIQGMSDEEIQAAGHDTPPFHFLCRSVVTLVNTEVQYDPVPVFPTDLSDIGRDASETLADRFTPMLAKLLGAPVASIPVVGSNVISDIAEQAMYLALHYYTKSGYRRINEATRYNSTPDREVVDHIRAIDDAFDKVDPLDKELFVYRGVSSSTLQKLQTGKVFQDDGFASTTLNPGVALEWKEVVMQIHVAKGQKVIPLEQITGSSSEYEMLLPRGTQYRVIGVEDQRIGGRNTRVVKVVAQGKGAVLDPGDIGFEELPKTESVIKDEASAQADKFVYREGDLREVSRG